MKKLASVISTIVLAAVLVQSVLACGPGYTSPVFDVNTAPESPYREYAAGKLGIVKPTYRRSILLAAYRYLTGGGFSDAEQKDLIRVWEAEINHRNDDDTTDLEAAVKAWLAQRKSVLGSEAKVPEIYTERSWGGYDFFPNCTKNAFETATKTLSDRSVSYGSDNKDVKNWIEAQDQVFTNCAVGKSIPGAPSAEMPEWLRKDRAYQIAAAQFYSLDFNAARQGFEGISRDSDSPWQEVSEYLVGRTLIRAASLSRNDVRSNALYAEADQALQVVAAKGGHFAADADRLLGVVKYRLRPAERLHELAQNIAYRSGTDFRQDIVDYTWLLDKYEKEALDKEDKRKLEVELGKNPEATPEPTFSPTPPPDPNKLTLFVWDEETSQSYNLEVAADISDDDLIALAEKTVGKPLSKEKRDALKVQRQSAFSGRFNDGRDDGYQGGYYGESKLNMQILPIDFRQDDLTEWLFVYQMESVDSYDYALDKLRATGTDMWLMTAISKAHPGSPDLDNLIDKAEKIPTDSAAFATVFYHLARLNIELGKPAEAKALLDQLISSPIDFPVSTRNQFLKLRMPLSASLEEFLASALRTPYAFDFDGEIGSLDEELAERKTWWSPEAFPDQSQDEYNKSLEAQFDRYRTFASERTFDDDSIEIFNRYFPTDLIVKAERSTVIPNHIATRLAIAAWTRAVLLNDDAVARQAAAELIRRMPELKDSLDAYIKATTPVARKRAALFIMLRNPILTPVVEIGFDADNDAGEWDADNWWCSWTFNTENEEPSSIPSPPKFLTAAQLSLAKSERSRLMNVGDAPEFFGKQVLEWARLVPADKRVPEALYLAWKSNGWNKYGCGTGPEAQEPIANVLKTKYPNSDWTKKLDENPEQ